MAAKTTHNKSDKDLLRGDYRNRSRKGTGKAQDSTSQTQDKIRKYNLFQGYEDTDEDTESKESLTINKQTPPSPDIISSEKRINMAFSDPIYNHLMQRSSELGVTIAFYLNETISNASDDAIKRYYDSLLIKPNKAHISRRKGAASKRITVKFTPEVHDKIKLGAEHYNQTLTQYVNMVIDSSIK